MSRSHEYPHYKRVIDGIIVGGVGALTLSGCAYAQEVVATPPSATTETPATTTPSITTSTEWPKKSGAPCDATRLPLFGQQPGGTGYYVYETRTSCTDSGVDVYEKRELTGTPVGELQPETPFALYCVAQIGNMTIGKVGATEIHPVDGYVALGAQAAQFTAQIPNGVPDCAMMPNQH
ncbi:MAG TPA: hypothetical protein VLG11_03035 [Candidatus Saccharimonadales bacterium]|nr:hypothetical protein [Candidatus Saccharimonadales bacterium]